MDSNSDSEVGCTAVDGLNLTNPDNKTSTHRDGVHNFLYHKLLS